jgi:26S proteasome regulatory subunit N5
MNEHIVTLSKRRSQLKQAITKMVQEAYELVEKTPDLDTKLKLIETLRTVTTGKVRTTIIKENLFILNYSFKDFC